MRSLIFYILIIAILPVSVMAHGEAEHSPAATVEKRLETEAGVLPGETFYFIDRLGEWVEVNLLTLSTKQKQVKLVRFADERVAELAELVELSVLKRSAYERALSYYRKDLLRAEDMAEKILFLDGLELSAVAEPFERRTFDQEVVLHSVLEAAPMEAADLINESLMTARTYNQKMFEYMVVNYQFTDQDIEKYVSIVRRHLVYIASELEQIEVSGEQRQKILQNLTEAEEHLLDGLSIGAYERIDRVKDIFYQGIWDTK